MAEFNLDFIAETPTAFGWQSHCTDWLQRVNTAFILQGGRQDISAIFHQLCVAAPQGSVWRFHDALCPEFLTGVILPERSLAALSPAWLPQGRPPRQAPTLSCIPISVGDELWREPQVPADIYRHLRIAREYLRDLSDFWQSVPALTSALSDLRDSLVATVLSHAPGGDPQILHAFGSSVSSHGPYAPVLDFPPGSVRRTLIAAPPGSSVSVALRLAAQVGVGRGHTAVLLHSSLDPAIVEHLYFTDMRWLVSHNVAPHWREPQPSDQTFDLTEAALGHQANDKLELWYRSYAQAYHLVWSASARMAPLQKSSGQAVPQSIWDRWVPA